MFDMEADRIRDLALDPKIIESEGWYIPSAAPASTTTRGASCRNS